MIVAGLALIVAQTCASLLPPADVQIDWTRNGQAYARDLPVRASASERVYRRTFQRGNADVTRILSCSTGRDGPTLHDRTDAAEVSIPVRLPRSRAVTLNGATIRRIEALDDAGDGGLWFSVSRYGPQLFAVSERIGIQEIRTPTVSGRVEILRGVFAALETLEKPLPAEDPRIPKLTALLTEQERLSRSLLDTVAQRTRALEAQRSAFADSLRRLGARLSTEIGANTVARGARLIADSAQKLPSEDAAGALGWVWPGAGHPTMGRSGAGWATLGVAGVAVAVAGLAIPDQTFIDNGVEPDQARRGALIGGLATYLVALLVSHSSLNHTIAAASGAHATRESFLRDATVAVTSSGALVVTLRRGSR